MIFKKARFLYSDCEPFSMAISQQEVQKIAKLARLSLTEGEVATLAGQLSAIIDHAKVLNEVDTKNVPATAQITGLSSVTFADEVKACKKPEALIACSPQSVQNGMIKIQSIF